MHLVLIRLIVLLSLLALSSCFGPGLDDDPTGMYTGGPEAGMDDDDTTDVGNDDDAAGDDDDDDFGDDDESGEDALFQLSAEPATARGGYPRVRIDYLDAADAGDADDAGDDDDSGAS